MRKFILSIKLLKVFSILSDSAEVIVKQIDEHSSKSKQNEESDKVKILIFKQFYETLKNFTAQ